MAKMSKQVKHEVLKGYRAGGTSKRRKLIRCLVQSPDMTQKELAAAAGMCRSGVQKALRDPQVTEAIQLLLESHPQLRRVKRLERLAQGVWARKKIIVSGKLVEVDDLPTSKGFLDTAFRMAGDLKGDNDVPVGDRVSLAVIILNERERRGLEPIPSEIVNQTQRRLDNGRSV